MKRSAPLRRNSGLSGSSLATYRPICCRVKLGGCGESFYPKRNGQIACGEDCAARMGPHIASKKAEKARKAEKRADNAKRRDLKPLQYWLGKAEQAVNRYVRARDFHKGCISCHLPASWDGQWHASHFRSVGAASAVRFHLWNIHKACWICNKQHSGNIGEYTPRLIALIGQERVDWLKAQNHVADYSREYLERLARVFNKKARRQEARNAR